MKYYRGYKYVVAETFSVQTDILGFSIQDKLTNLKPDGILTIQRWYPWDGNSGPCIDFKSSLKASAVHDVLCDYINMGWLPDYLQPIADQEYYKIAVSKSMWWRRARIRLLAIRWYMTGKGAKRFTRKISKHRKTDGTGMLKHPPTTRPCKGTEGVDRVHLLSPDAG